MNNKLKIVFCSIFAALLLWLCVGITVGIAKIPSNEATPQWQDVMSVEYLYGDSTFTNRSTFSVICDLDNAIELSDEVFNDELGQLNDKTIVGKFSDYTTPINLPQSGMLPSETPKIGDYLFYRGANKDYKVRVSDIKISYVSVRIKDGVLQIKKDGIVIQVENCIITYFND